MARTDTTPEAQAVLTQLYRDAGPRKCLQMALRMSQECRTISVSGIRSRHPAASEEQVRWEVAKLYLGVELAGRVFGPKGA